ncbi:MAG: antibiotic biosynthesis monooxygenase family protein [Gammaproteobacteria bacterium]
MGLNIEEMDARVSVFAQMESENAPVVLINKFTAPPEAADALLAAWTHDAEFMRARPGFVSTQLHRGIGGSGVFVNVAEWESVAAFRAAFSHPEFRARLENYPPGVSASPHLFKKVAVPGVCGGGSGECE